MKQNSLIRTFLLSALTLSACGPQAFVPTTIVSNQTAAGSINLPPRVDILVSVSTDGGMANILPNIQTELNEFANRLQNSGWDYRMVTLSMSETVLPSIESGNIYFSLGNQVAISKYHTNYLNSAFASNYVAPYPGASPTDPYYTLNPDALANLGGVSIVAQAPVLNGHQTGLKNQAKFLNISHVKNNILRSDANLAVITISNGRDASDGWVAATSSITSGGSQTNNLVPGPVNVAGYVNSMQSVKGTPNMMKYYSVTSFYQRNDNSCHGGPARSGADYKIAAEATGGKAIDLCTNSIADSLTQVRNHIQSQPMYFKKDHLVIDSQPEPSSIKIYKNGIALPQSQTDGWEYLGYISTPTALIYWPAPLDKRTGYLIKLNGTARLEGNDTARVEYMNFGVQASH